MRVDGEVKEIARGMKTDRYKNHDIEVVIDKMQVQPKDKDNERLKKTVATAMKQGDGLIMILDHETDEAKYFSKRLMCPTREYHTAILHRTTSRSTRLKAHAHTARDWDRSTRST